ncbi:MAG TPA: GNAT family N-acetyltransferase [Solirubrobacteraceae bacterium]|jgi:phosphinothricin acetyltransferase|nr:GNAT family N-acetyltransferase [Solirubrobacteraceae bacterium]
MSPAPAIRPAELADLGAVGEIYAHYVRHTFVTFDLEPPTPGDWRASWRAAQRDRHPWWVAEAGNEVLGFLSTSAFRPKAAYRPTVETTIYLAPEAAGQGLGTALYEVGLPRLTELGFHRATAGIALPNPASVALHERMGFTLVGVFDEVGHKLGGWRDVGWWRRAL